MTNKPGKTSEIFGMKVRIERTKRKLSQEKFSEKADISKPALGAIERGESSPTLETIVKIANALEIDLPEMFNFNF